MNPDNAAQATLREVIETLAPLERRAGEPGELAAAEWITARLTQAGCETAIEEAQFRDGFAALLRNLAAASAGAGLAALVSRRLGHLSAGMAALAGLAIADDVSNGPRVARRLSQSPRQTWNVVGHCGDPTAERTLVVMAHHDAGSSGMIFDDRLQAWLGEQFPGILERIDTSLPMWWTVLAAPGLVAAGAARRRRGLLLAGLVGSAVSAAAFADIARSPIVPGANDNLSAVAVLVALAERLAAEPVTGVRVLLVSCGAEEVLQGGIYSFAERHFPALDRERTWFLDLEALGSPRLVLVEGEGPVVMEDYFDRSFRDLIARAAEQVGAPLRRGMRARVSTDAVIPNRAGYPTALLTSMDRNKSLSNYHKMTDTPENIDYRTVGHALTVCEAVARELAVNPWR